MAIAEYAPKCLPKLPQDCSGVLRIQENVERAVTLTGGVLTENMRREAKGVSALFRSGSFRGFASSSDSSHDSIVRVIDAARRNFELLGQQRSAPAADSAAFRYIPEGKDCEQSRLIEAVRYADGLIMSRCPNIIGRKVRLHTLSTEKELFPFSGAFCHALNPRTNIYVTLTAKSVSGTAVTVSDSIGGIGFYDAVFADMSVFSALVDELYEDLMQKCSPVKCADGEAATVMSDCTGILIHEAFGHIAEGDSVVEGSVLRGKIGMQTASELINATDIAVEAFGIGVPQPQFIDDEGNVCTDAPLIRSGSFCGYMTDCASAAELGTAVTGNARAATYADAPIVRMRNTAIHPGTSSLKEMIASTQRGVYIKRTGGGQADMTGRYMFKVQTAYLIEDGELRGALPDFTCTGNSFDTLRQVSMVGSEIRWRHSSLCGKQGQTVAVGMTGPAIKTVTQINGVE